MKLMILVTILGCFAIIILAPAMCAAVAYAQLKPKVTVTIKPSLEMQIRLDYPNGKRKDIAVPSSVGHAYFEEMKKFYAKKEQA